MFFELLLNSDSQVLTSKVELWYGSSATHVVSITFVLICGVLSPTVTDSHQLSLSLCEGESVSTSRLECNDTSLSSDSAGI